MSPGIYNLVLGRRPGVSESFGDPNLTSEHDITCVVSFSPHVHDNLSHYEQSQQRCRRQDHRYPRFSGILLVPHIRAFSWYVQKEPQRLQPLHPSWQGSTWMVT